MRTCPSCHLDWPEDRFIEKSDDCFKCRAASIQFNYGPRGKAQFHDITVKEYNDRQIREARANGLDPVPVHTATTAVPTKRMMDGLKGTLDANK